MNTKRISWRLWRVNNQALLADAVQQLQTASESARADAEILLAHCLQKSRTYLFAYPETAVDSLTEASFRELLAERLRGVPIAHLTGQREFWTLNLKVTPDTLIPRPETELLVETALELGNSSRHILDLGTGTGAIALAIASERPDVQVTACDFSAAALAVAQENAQVNSIHNVHFIQSDWFSALPAQRFDMIVSNPPYIEADDPHLAQGDVRFEPLTALASGQDGLDDIRHLIQTAPQWLVNGGWLLLEHGYNQGKAVTALLQTTGFQQVHCLPDLAGNDRVSLGQWLTIIQ
ncbi:peptide chain release factor N(5)-glutamine methyltransferase [Thiothrix lacustris]|uniref:Release factor glutamine methyltransferase n=1 Tax=Thiothrix lacustris TaxID=525917 RepID=A0ABY9MR35_9GAMM|nr:peptide chain release factor N(5)-glutamine methyltransferase [Thiothrix lacustris]WML91118.1 peptide chain release factor N(5)-glutamine methyltransferase [Thiothrix lacustris]